MTHLATFDARCYDLAEHFLTDTSWSENITIIEELASAIQEIIEDFIKELEEEEEENKDE